MRRALRPRRRGFRLHLPGGDDGSEPFARPPGTAGSGDTDPIDQSATTVTTATTAPPSTASTLPPTTAPATPVDITGDGAPSASSTFSGEFLPSFATDGDPTTSWFSKGDADGSTSTFTWKGTGDHLIARVTVTGNTRHSNPAFRRNEGFRSSKMEVLDAAGAVVFTRSFTGPGNAAPNLMATPNVRGRTVRLSLSGHEDPKCGGFSEINVEAVD